MIQQQKIDWHRLLGLIFTDFFTGSAWNVELEKDLSMKRQLLDIIILRQDSGGLIHPLPDGLEGMKKHNLLTFKSIREPLDDWAMKELTGHYVNYRKQISPSFSDLYPEDQFQLYGVSTRYPKKLSSQLELTKVQDGVYDIHRGSDNIRLIVLNEIPHAKHNAIWHLFSGIPGEIEFAARQYRGKTQEISTVLNRLFENYQLEGIPMAYTMEDFKKDYVKEHLGVLSPDDRLRGLSTDEVLNRFSPDDRLKGLSLDEVLNKFSAEELRQYLEKKQRKDNQ
ncbi:MAG: hypothetical protein Q3M30_06415 [Candidatus Electrothrix sp. Rat3]|nr:hypothetical protein [Candidatus Electrothrix rattekaaiensis]